jgi:hypothetical protein
LTWGEFHALSERLKESRESEWMRASIIATSVLNVNRGKGKPLALDFFVPKVSKAAKPAEPELSPEARELRRQIVQMDLFLARTKNGGGAVDPVALEKRAAAVERLKSMMPPKPE